MPASLHQAGDYLDYTPEANYVAGTPVALAAGLVGIGGTDVAAGQLASLAIGGVYKANNSGIALAVGVACGYDAAEDEIVAATEGTFDIGTVVYAAATGDADVYFLLNDRTL